MPTIQTNTATCLNIQFSGTINRFPNPKVITHLYVDENGRIKDSTKRRWVNNQSIISTAKHITKINNNSIYFPGKNRQKLMTNSNIFYNLSSFTLIAWIKTTSINKVCNTLIEVIPKSFLLSSSLYSNDKETTDILDSYEKSIKNNTVIGIEGQILNTETINKKYDKLDWNHLVITYKDKNICYYLNGNKISQFNIDLSNLPQDYITVIGGNCLNDLNKSDVCSMYLNDLILYDRLLFEFGINKFKIPKNGILEFKQSIIYDNIPVCREIIRKKIINNYISKNLADRHIEVSITCKNTTKYIRFAYQKSKSIL